jgi:transcriptional regulator with XRE-family HTH domain
MGLRDRIEPDDEAFYAAIARQVAEQRTAHNLSQRELAELCGTTQSAIARFEAGTRPPRLDTLRRMAAALDCALDVNLRPRTTPTRKADQP